MPLTVPWVISAWCGITPQYMIICWTAHSWRENAQIGMLGRKCEIRRAGTTGGRRHGDALGANGGSHVYSGHTHNVVDDAGAVSIGRNLERSVGREVFLSLESNAGLHLDGLDRVLTGSGLAREHNGVGAVVDGVSNVGNLGARRARILLHGVEHLRSGDDGLVGRVATWR